MYNLGMHSAIFFYSDRAKNTMVDIVENLPSDVDVYIVGGVLRNALVRKYHNEIWTQRDYDQVTTGNSDRYLDYLREIGFDFRGIEEPRHKTASKPVVDNARQISYVDNLVFDIHLADATDIMDNLRHSSGLSINGFALNLRDIFANDWEDRLLSLPGALDCIKSKQILLNEDGYRSEPNFFFALLRFMGLGFSGPPQDDATKLLNNVCNLSTEKYQKNITKLVSYLGSEERVRDVVDSLGIDKLDIFDEDATRIVATNL